MLNGLDLNKCKFNSICYTEIKPINFSTGDGARVQDGYEAKV